MMKGLDLVAVEVPETCKGKIYRYSENKYRNSKGALVLTNKFVPMKRLSCQGCDKCFWIDEHIDEDLGCGDFPEMNDVTDGQLYRLVVTQESIDRETGYDEIEAMGFIKVPNDE